MFDGLAFRSVLEKHPFRWFGLLSSVHRPCFRILYPIISQVSSPRRGRSSAALWRSRARNTIKSGHRGTGRYLNSRKSIYRQLIPELRSKNCNVKSCKRMPGWNTLARSMATRTTSFQTSIVPVAKIVKNEVQKRPQERAKIDQYWNVSIRAILGNKTKADYKLPPQQTDSMIYLSALADISDNKEKISKSARCLSVFYWARYLPEWSP